MPERRTRPQLLHSAALAVVAAVGLLLAVALRLTLDGGPDSGRTWDVTVPRDAVETTFHVVLANAANEVTLSVAVVNPKHSEAVQLVPAAPFDVLHTSLGRAPGRS